MPGNITGKIFRVMTYGESHGPYIGAVIDGCPAGLEIDLEFMRRRNGKKKTRNR